MTEAKSEHEVQCRLGALELAHEIYGCGPPERLIEAANLFISFRDESGSDWCRLLRMAGDALRALPASDMTSFDPIELLCCAEKLRSYMICGAVPNPDVNPSSEAPRGSRDTATPP